MRYAFHEGVDICVLTNGLEWWLYLPRERDPFEQRRFSVLKTHEGPIRRLVSHFESFLSKESLLSGQAEKRGKQTLQAKREADYLAAELPELWKQMLAEPDDGLVELIGKRAYEQLNARPTKEQTSALLRSSPLLSSVPDTRKTRPTKTNS